jgi:hypothetical protein
MEEEHTIEVEINREQTPPGVDPVEISSESAAQESAETAEESTTKPNPKRDKAPSSIKDALKQAETFAQTLGEALQGRGNVVMVRVNDDALDHLDMLIEAEITKSRSESAAFLINEGINANEALFSRISAITDQIAELRDRLRQEVKLPSQGSADDEEKPATD